jgi:large subunit ribosomal protein L34e
MPSGNKKSGSFRKVFKRTPGGRNVIHYESRKPAQQKCAGCGKALAGIPRLKPSKVQNIAKTKRRPQRAFGGFLCSSCARRVLISESRS